MQSFTQLLAALAHAADEAAKVEALTRYFRDATPADAAWALYLLTGRRLARSASVAELRRWAGEASGLPGWLIELSIEMAGDAAEAIALLLAASAAPGEAGPLHALIEERLLPLKELGDAKRRAAVLGLWGRLDSAGRILWNKLLGGELRGGPERGLIVRALAAAERGGDLSQRGVLGQDGVGVEQEDDLAATGSHGVVIAAGEAAIGLVGDDAQAVALELARDGQ